MYILLTGGAGFIGSHVAVELINAGYRIICVDNFCNSIADENGNASSLKRVEKIVGSEVPFMFADCTNEESVENVFQLYKIVGVIHLAGLKSVGESWQLPLDYYWNNISSTLILLKICKKYHVKNFIFSSSATVYGIPKKNPVTEDTPVGIDIENPYGQTKHMIEKILMDLCKSDEEWKVILLRYFNPVGAHPSGLIGEDPQGIPSNLMPFIGQVAIRRLPYLKIFGDTYPTRDGTGIRDYIHVVDLARGHIAALRRIDSNSSLECEAYNLGTGVGYSVKEMVAAYEKTFGEKIAVKLVEKRTGDVACIYCDPALALKKLQWKSQFNIEDMCRDSWNWQSKNPFGYKSQ